MLNNVEAVIFDLDGTLVDSMWIWKDIDIEYLNRYDIILPDKFQEGMEGMSFSETALYFKNFFNIEDSIEKIKRDWNYMAKDKYAHEVPVKDGVIDFLKYLKKKNIKTGIATSNSKELVNELINAHNMNTYFDAIHTSCEVKKGKPSPDIYQFVAKQLEVSENKCLVFEDVIQGIMAGKNAGMKVCAVYDEYSKDIDKEKRELADYYIKSFYDINCSI
jgi:HAD superfamily hydrolase (TIGR01509 family)